MTHASSSVRHFRPKKKTISAKINLAYKISEIWVRFIYIFRSYTGYLHARECVPNEHIHFKIVRMVQHCLSTLSLLHGHRLTRKRSVQWFFFPFFNVNIWKCMAIKHVWTKQNRIKPNRTAGNKTEKTSRAEHGIASISYSLVFLPIHLRCWPQNVRFLRWKSLIFCN